jgi:small subunit ribosomal protein S16
MALKIRLRQQGRTNLSVYRLVVTDSRTPRDGKYLEMLGWYNPVEAEEDKKISVKEDRVQHWLDQGAQLTDNAEALLKKTAPAIIRQQTEKKLAIKARAATKRKAKSKAKA